MVRASAKRLPPESSGQVRKRKVKKVVINMDKVRRFLRVSGLLVLLTMANASIQALVAQAQFHVANIQAELKTVDQQIGWLQWELASRTSQQQLTKLASNGEETDYIEQPGDSLRQITPKLVLPPSILNLNPTTAPSEQTVTAKIYDWLSGIGRTMAEGALSE